MPKKDPNGSKWPKNSKNAVKNEKENQALGSKSKDKNDPFDPKEHEEFTTYIRKYEAEIFKEG